MCQENYSRTVTPAAAWPIGITQDESMLLCCIMLSLCQIVTLAAEIETTPIFTQAFDAQFEFQQGLPCLYPKMNLVVAM